MLCFNILIHYVAGQYIKRWLLQATFTSLRQLGISCPKTHQLMEYVVVFYQLVALVFLHMWV
jgi:hypothetical protein